MPTFNHEGKSKKQFVRQMFDDISPSYDFLNHLLSLGIDIHWRKKFISYLNIKDGDTVLDMACGTGDVGFEILKHYQIQLINIDISSKMLDIAEKKAQGKRLNNIQFTHGDAEEIPLENESVNFLTIAYGFRNIGHYEKALKEFYRVLKPGGILGILEFSIPKNRIFGWFFKFYFHQILPRIGNLLSSSDAYHYLPESVDFFPSREDIGRKIIYSGFQRSNFIDYHYLGTDLCAGKRSPE